MNKYQNNKQEELAPSKDVTNKAIYTNFSKFFKWCKDHINDLDEYEDIKKDLNNNPIDIMICMLVKYFNDSYESYGEGPLNMLIGFFIKLNEKSNCKLSRTNSNFSTKRFIR